MYQIVITSTVFPVLFCLILVFLELGRRFRLRQRVVGQVKEGAGLEVIEGAIFGLMALLVAFSFSGASSRFDARRQLVVEEANCIGTAYLRLDLLPGEQQPSLREKFRRYTDSRLEMYAVLPDIVAAKAAYARSGEIQAEIWREATASVMAAPTDRPALLLLPAINEMIDISTTRYMAAQFHSPDLIIILLILLTCFCALLAGFRMAGSTVRNWAHIFIFAALMSMTIYVIIDFEYPRFGLIKLDTYDQVLIDARAAMK